MHDGHESEVCEARRDGVGIGDQDIGLQNDVRGILVILVEKAYTLEIAVHNVGVVEVAQSFNGIRELKGVGKW